MAFVFAVLIVVKFDGIHRYSVAEASTGVLEMKRLKERPDAVDNRRWAAYFGVVSTQFALAATLLQIHFTTSHSEALRIATLVNRLLLGTACVLLSVTLIHQSTHRTRDYAALKNINSKRQRQSTMVLRVCVVIYLVYVAGEFIASHAVPMTDYGVRLAMFWTHIVALLLVNIPAVVATVWVCFHQAQIQPSRAAKRIALAGIVIHFITACPPSFWNQHLLASFVTENPCPFGVFSFYDLVLLLHMAGTALLFAFAVLEYRRNAVVVLDAAFQQYSTGLALRATAHPSDGYGSLNDDARSLNTLGHSHVP